MALQASGAISFSDIQTEWSDSGDLSASDMYKDGGSLGVASTVISVGAYTGFIGSVLPPEYGIAFQSSSSLWFVYWNGSALYSGGSNPNNTVISGFQYNTDFVSAGTTESGNTQWYRVRRRTYSSVSANTNVPTSGTITLSDFYGGRAS